MTRHNQTFLGIFLSLFFICTKSQAQEKTTWYNLSPTRCAPWIGFRAMGGVVNSEDAIYTFQRLLAVKGIGCEAGPLAIQAAFQLGQAKLGYQTATQTGADLELTPEMSFRIQAGVNLLNLFKPSGLQIRLSLLGGWEGLLGPTELKLNQFAYQSIDLSDFVMGTNSPHGPRFKNVIDFGTIEVGAATTIAFPKKRNLRILLTLETAYQRFYKIRITATPRENLAIDLIKLFQISPDTLSVDKSFNSARVSTGLTLLLPAQLFVAVENSILPFKFGDGPSSYIYESKILIGYGIPAGLVKK
jgi:hypothetical protein